ncbi:MAG: acyl-CoA dehydrogenase family protein [Nocardioidaceae bacterium]|nr:acyl-CoA dehydrogenase family protein [Nocardioidaceae bacterium]
MPSAPTSPHRRDAMGLGLAAMNKLAGLPVLDRLGLRAVTEQAVYHGAKAGFQTAGAVSRRFPRRRATGGVVRHSPAQRSGVFDLTPTEDQQMMVDVVGEFAAEVLRPAAEKADDACEAPADLLARTADLGLTLVGVPEDLGGLSAERSATTGVLVGEALAHGDMGLAVACLAPHAVATALASWGTADQQATYLGAFTGEDVPAAALAVAEPHAFFDPFALRTTATRSAAGFRLDGVKAAVVRGPECELFVVAAHLEGSGPALFLLESGTPGIVVEAEPSMGVRAAGLSRLVLDGVEVPWDALLGDGDAAVYADCVRRARIAWCSLALGTGRAVLDYVVPYVKERKAFGEPVAHRQSVAFMVANIGIELEGMRLTTLRAASRADQGLDFARETAVARRLCSEHGMRIGTDGVQLLGGHGFVKEHPVERWYRDLRAIGVMEGGLLV